MKNMHLIMTHIYEKKVQVEKKEFKKKKEILCSRLNE